MEEEGDSWGTRTPEPEDRNTDSEATDDSKDEAEGESEPQGQSESPQEPTTIVQRFDVNSCPLHLSEKSHSP